MATCHAEVGSGRARDISSATTTAGWQARWWFGYLHCLMVGLRELLGCNVIVFDAVILQCRAYTHASVARGHIGHIRGAKCRDNCRAFPPPPSGPSAGSFAFWMSSFSVHDSLPPPCSGAICQVARPFHHVDQEHLEVFQPTSCLDVFSLRSSSESRLDGRVTVVSRLPNAEFTSFFGFNRSWKVAPSSLNISGNEIYMHISEVRGLLVSPRHCREEVFNLRVRQFFKNKITTKYWIFSVRFFNTPEHHGRLIEISRLSKEYRDLIMIII